ncbi:MAG TPA: TIGR03087 family PEP-CTERM/XrtA system glycosyltransferase [Novosphingobium sp.]|nr:TIGR03087 family PEP-CTERM/XrtA system glycosyltransferase [Novosphingobium sp.]
MPETLFLSHRIPFPPDRGDKIRSHHILKRLAARGSVHVATFADDDADFDEEAELAIAAHSYRLVRRSTRLFVAGIKSLLRGEPVSLPAFYSEELARYVLDTLAGHPIGTIYVFSGQMGQYVPEDFAGRVIVDFVDVDSVKFEAYAWQNRGIERWIHAREARLLRREEARLAARAHTSLLISAQEAALFAARLPAVQRMVSDIRVVGNGIDCQFFDPAEVTPEASLAGLPGPRLIFTGQMDYSPNIAAALRLATRILPLVQRELPEASCHIVGRNPDADLLALDGKHGCRVWGRVEDIRSWLAAATQAVVPLEIARGVQNKVLEAMAMGLPVVLTSGAANGIAASDGRDFAIADSDEDIAARIVALHRDPVVAAAMRAAARKFVVEQQSWPAALAPLDTLLGAPGASVRHAA